MKKRKNKPVNIENVNRPPVIEKIKNQTINEGDYLEIIPIYSDPDNKNNVTSDDNNISITTIGIMNDQLSINFNY